VGKGLPPLFAEFESGKAPRFPQPKKSPVGPSLKGNEYCKGRPACLFDGVCYLPPINYFSIFLSLFLPSLFSEPGSLPHKKKNFPDATKFSPQRRISSPLFRNPTAPALLSPKFPDPIPPFLLHSPNGCPPPSWQKFTPWTPPNCSFPDFFFSFVCSRYLKAPHGWGTTFFSPLQGAYAELHAGVCLVRPTLFRVLWGHPPSSVCVVFLSPENCIFFSLFYAGHFPPSEMLEHSRLRGLALKMCFSPPPPFLAFFFSRPLISSNAARCSAQTVHLRRTGFLGHPGRGNESRYCQKRVSPTPWALSPVFSSTRRRRRRATGWE